MTQLPPSSDRSLLAAWAHQQDRAAFETLVHRHLNLVYAAARRQLADPAAAEDATQAVFLILSRKSTALLHLHSLPAWLHAVTRYACREASRADRRRRARETTAHLQSGRTHAMPDPDPVETAEVRALLDDHLARLASADRHALILRYLQDLPLAAVATELGVSEEAAKKRVARAVARLRALFVRSGVALSATVITQSFAAPPAPPHVLAQVLSGVSTAPVASATSSLIAKGALKMMLITKLKIAAAIGLAALTLTAGGAALVKSTLAADNPPAAPVAETPAALPDVDTLLTQYRPFTSWSKFPVGTQVIQRMTVQSPGLNQPIAMEMHCTLHEVTPVKVHIDAVVTAPAAPANPVSMKMQPLATAIEYARDGGVLAGSTHLDTIEDVAKSPDLRALPGTETLTVSGKAYVCTRVTATLTTNGNTGTVTLWLSPDMPGSLVKSETNITQPMSSTIIQEVTDLKLPTASAPSAATTPASQPAAWSTMPRTIDSAPGEYYVTGVKRPGVYAMPPTGVTVRQALIAAGYDPAADASARVMVYRRTGQKDEQRWTTTVADLFADQNDLDRPLAASDILTITPAPVK